MTRNDTGTLKVAPVDLNGRVLLSRHYGSIRAQQRSQGSRPIDSSKSWMLERSAWSADSNAGNPVSRKLIQSGLMRRVLRGCSA
jgi:hypothetical protein